MPLKWKQRMPRFKRPFILIVGLFAMIQQSVLSCAAADGVQTLTPAPAYLQGRYEGYLPCADCPGIEYKLWLREDGTYVESSFYSGRSERPTIRTGAYFLEGINVILDKKDEGLTQFARHPQGLQVLNIQGQPITGDLSYRYVLTRKTGSNGPMLTNETLMLMRKKLARGIGFYALGNEPFWSLDIDFDKGMTFKSLTDLPEMMTPPGREDKAQDADVTRFFAQTEAGTLIVTVLRGECADSMADVRFPFRVTVDVKQTADNDFTRFSGCGRYVMDPRLNDIWVLTNFAGRSFNPDDFARGLPIIEFHLADDQVVGSTGCNQISGRFDARADKISIKYLRTTRMACPDMTFEQEFLDAISDRMLLYSINDGRLILAPNDRIILEFKKTD